MLSEFSLFMYLGSGGPGQPCLRCNLLVEWAPTGWRAPGSCHQEVVGHPSAHSQLSKIPKPHGWAFN